MTDLTIVGPAGDPDLLLRALRRGFLVRLPPALVPDALRLGARLDRLRNAYCLPA